MTEQPVEPVDPPSSVPLRRARSGPAQRSRRQRRRHRSHRSRRSRRLTGRSDPTPSPDPRAAPPGPNVGHSPIDGLPGPLR
jgi:hypothetical protein